MGTALYLTVDGTETQHSVSLRAHESMLLVTLRARSKVKDNMPQSYSLDSPVFSDLGL